MQHIGNQQGHSFHKIMNKYADGIFLSPSQCSCFLSATSHFESSSRNWLYRLNAYLFFCSTNQHIWLNPAQSHVSGTGMLCRPATLWRQKMLFPRAGWLTALVWKLEQILIVFIQRLLSMDDIFEKSQLRSWKKNEKFIITWTLKRCINSFLLANQGRLHHLYRSPRVRITML